jgi:hypothetical protein
VLILAGRGFRHDMKLAERSVRRGGLFHRHVTRQAYLTCTLTASAFRLPSEQNQAKGAALPASLNSFKATLEKLIRRFDADRTHYLSKGYNEAQARVDFISPFFKALGWDVENEEGLAHHEREVVVEAAEDTGGRPDYGFRVSGQTRFFVEARHLTPFKARLQERATEQNWYELQQPQLNFATYMDGPKIIFPDIAITPRFSLDEVGRYGSNTTYFIPLPDLYLLGILNSRLGNFYFSQVCAGLEGPGETYLRFFGQYLEGFPIRAIDCSKAADVDGGDKIVALVGRMLDLTKRKHSGKLAPSELQRLERQISATDSEIDDLVFKLYGITAEERKIIEGASPETQT